MARLRSALACLAFATTIAAGVGVWSFLGLPRDQRFAQETSVSAFGEQVYAIQEIAVQRMNLHAGWHHWYLPAWRQAKAEGKDLLVFLPIEGQIEWSCEACLERDSDVRRATASFVKVRLGTGSLSRFWGTFCEQNERWRQHYFGTGSYCRFMVVRPTSDVPLNDDGFPTGEIILLNEALGHGSDGFVAKLNELSTKAMP